ncbi:hypothetical protein BDZ94DRAFT_1310540 [Collybia nuda]|uniref:C2H2-type domain-containing protein n=1 Tax=Collybia nuda TaxID=64659 RepID=A0A9P5Y2J4_9AGAR|nr:hypothetical protein BDZ94DRAFT_1310540 [Collybia nuda]
MPTCIHCDRPFLNKEALHQHLASSTSQHPFCEKCDRRFISQVALESHTAAKHPPSYNCDPCNRSFTTSFALDDHYRGSTAHPNCARCGKGFKDVNERDEHRKTTHPLATCSCGIIIEKDAIEVHYKNSPNHPSCIKCGGGFKDNAAYADHIQDNHTKSEPILTPPNTRDDIQTSASVHRRDLPPPSQAIDRAWISTRSTPVMSPPYRRLYVATFPRTNPHHPLRQWPTDRSFNIQNLIPPQVSTKPKIGSSQQPVASTSQRDSWRSTKPAVGRNDTMGPYAGMYTESNITGSNFNPFGPITKS